MTVTLNHTIIHVYDAQKTADFLVEILGLSDHSRFGPFVVVQVDDTSLDLLETDEDISSRHFAFLISEAEFDEIFSRIRERGVPYWADPGRNKPGEINRRDGGRGVYFEDPNGHFLEILTRPYGSGED